MEHNFHLINNSICMEPILGGGGGGGADINV